jgi:hypothetical protein
MYRFIAICLVALAIAFLGAKMYAYTNGLDANAGQTGEPDTASLAVNGNPAIRNIPRIGVNLGTWTPYGAEQYASNIIMNPGFEPLVDRAIVIVKDSESSGFSDNTDGSARADGFWNNGTFQVLTGKSAGASGKIATSLSKGSNGMPWFTTSGDAPALAKGDAISVTRIQTSGVPWCWWIPKTPADSVAINTSDHRPNSPGSSSAELTLQPGQSTELDYYWDSEQSKIPGRKFLPVNGSWQLSLWARATGGSPSLDVLFSRLNGTPAWLNQTVNLTGEWQQYTFNFEASDTGPPQPLALKLVAHGQGGNAVRLDDVQLGRRSDFPGAWREELVGALTLMRPGYLRDTQGQLGDTLANRIGVAFGHGPVRYVPDPNNNAISYLYGLTDFLALCQQVGAQPWIVVPPTFYDSELTGLGRYLAQQQSTYRFNEIVVEWGNENWNPIFRSASIPDPAVMGKAANRAFGLIRQGTGPSVPLHMVVNGQFVSPWVSNTGLRNAPGADAVDIAPYFFDTLNSSDTMPTALGFLTSMSDETSHIADIRKAMASPHKDIDVYEVNLTTTAGNAPDNQREPLVAGMISGSALANRILTAMNSNIRRQCVFALSQYQFGTPVGHTDLWGIVRDLTSNHHFRPTGLALQMLNQAVGGDYYSVTAQGTSAGKITAAAFLTNAGWSLALVSTSPNPTRVSLKLPPQGTHPSRILTLSAPSITSTNESVDDEVRIVRTALAGDSQITIPPYGFVVALPPKSNPS